MTRPLEIVFIGLSITSSWGNGHATTYRSLIAALARRGHRVIFLERDVAWYAANRDLPHPPYCRTFLYQDMAELRSRFARSIGAADAVIVGSYVPDGVEVGRFVCEHATGVRAFYDIDTPVTIAQLERGECEYVDTRLIAEYDAYLSFTGGPTLARLEDEFRAPMARALYCSAGPAPSAPRTDEPRWELGYMGTYSADRQPALGQLLIEPARRAPSLRMVVAGPQYPADVDWPGNVERIEHLSPAEHPSFYASQRFTLNVTRADMIAAGYSPSVRLFEAAVSGVPAISDAWQGIDELFEPGREILLADTADDVLRILRDLPEDDRRRIGALARERVLAAHTPDHRAAELEGHLLEAALLRGRSGRRRALEATAG